MRKLLSQAIAMTRDGKLFPGIYKFNPCDPINIQGIGTVNKNESTVVLYLHDGTVYLNNSFDGDYVEWEIAALGTFSDFVGVCEGSNTIPFKPLNVSGRSEYALYIECTYMLEMRIDKEKYKRGVDIPVRIKRMVFPYMKIRDIELNNPHFYVFMSDENSEEINLIYDKELQVTWDLPLLGTKIWTWDQKDYNGIQVPDGNYSVVAEFEIDGIVHPVYGSGILIVEKYRNIKSINNLFYRILERLPNLFPFLKYIFLHIWN
jgi:hypothetical protein